MLVATARRYTMEQIEAARKKLRSLPVKEAGKTRGEVAEFLVNDIKKACGGATRYGTSGTCWRMPGYRFRLPGCEKC